MQSFRRFLMISAIVWTLNLLAVSQTFYLNQTNQINLEACHFCHEVEKITLENVGEKTLKSFHPTSAEKTQNQIPTFLSNVIIADHKAYYSQTGSAFLNWDNQTFASKEALAEDPLLFYRNNGFSKETLLKSIYHYAYLDFFNFSSSPSLSHITPLKFDLFPKEKLEYRFLPNSQIQIAQWVQLDQRSPTFTLEAPYAIQSIKNFSDYPVYVEELGKSILSEEEVWVENLSTVLHFQSQGEGLLKVSFFAPYEKWIIQLRKTQQLNLQASNPTSIRVNLEKEDLLFAAPKLKIMNKTSVFEAERPYFTLNKVDGCDSITWMISSDSHFREGYEKITQTQPYSESVTLSLLTETFLNPDQDYFFRVKASDSKEWSEPFTFTTTKPHSPLNAKFEKKEDGKFQLIWENSNPSTTYWIFGSHSIDFIPSIYTDVKVDRIDSLGNVIALEENFNLIGTTTKNYFELDQLLPFYRVIAEKDGIFSIPSSLIYLYDEKFCLPRNVLKPNFQQKIAKRLAIQPIYPVLDSILNPLHPPSPHVHPHIWAYTSPYFIPENHPVKYKLDRIFTKQRASLNAQTLSQSGFGNNTAGLFSGAVVTKHPEIKGYYIKLFTDDNPNRSDWQQWTTRIQGAHSIKQAIARHSYQKMFKVPQKWIYPLPVEPSPPPGFHRHNFILIAEEMDILRSRDNYRKWRKMSKHLLEAVFTLIKEEGLNDSMYAFNLPFCSDGRLAFIDTEHHHHWPLYFERMHRYLSFEMQKFLIKLVEERGANP